MQAERQKLENGLQLEKQVYKQKSSDFQKMSDAIVAEKLEASGAMTRRKKKVVPKRSGLMSRVGFLLGKKKRKPRKRRATKKPSKPRKKRAKKPSVVVPESSPVVDNIDEGPDIPSPRVRGVQPVDAPRAKSPVRQNARPVINDYVIKRKNKKYL